MQVEGTTRIDKAAERGRDKIVHYSVNAEPQETRKHKLTGREILENAGFKPGEDYILTRNKGHKEIGLADEEPVAEGEAFTAKFRGITPTS
jgi:hypothetical protein